MLRHFISELKETLICLEAGQVTLGYPFQPHAPEAGFRGLPVVDAMLCIGCGACANACPPRLIDMADNSEFRTVSFELSRCTYCGSCRDVCPAGAVAMSSQFETATPHTQDLRISLKLKLVRCALCGEVVGTQRAIDRVSADLVGAMGQAAETIGRLDRCIHCKRKEAMTTAGLAIEVSS
jgi:hydrogenase-4 component H